MHSIRTVYRKATNARASRISVVADDGSRYWYPYDHSLFASENHKAAALAVAPYLNWPNLTDGKYKLVGIFYNDAWYWQPMQTSA